MSNVKEVCSEESDGSVTSQTLWKYDIGSIVIRTWRLFRITRKIEFTGEPIKLQVTDGTKLLFERVELEFLDGEAMINSGIPESEVLRKTLAFSIFTHIIITAISRDGRRESKMFWLDGHMDAKPYLSVTSLTDMHYNDIDYVLIEFKDPTEYSDDEEEDDEEEEEEDSGVGEPPKKRMKLECR